MSRSRDDIQPMPTRRRRRLPMMFAAIAIACATAADLSSAQGLNEALKVRTKAVETNAASQERINEVADQTDELAREYRDELQQIEALRVYNEQLAKLLISQEEERVSLKEQLDNVTVIGREVTPLMLRMVGALYDFVELDVPFLLEERRARVANLKDLMNRADVTNAEKYRRILEAYQIENDFGRSIEAYRGTLEAGGEAKTVDFLRVGRVALLYQSLDGHEIGAWNQRDGAWQGLDGGFRSEIRLGLRIARKQAAPDLLRLPIPVAETAQ